MKNSESTGSGGLLVADSPGHILERIALSWRSHGPRDSFEVALSENISSGACCAKGSELGSIHWLDRHRGVKAAGLACCPQLAMIYHHLEGEESQVQFLAQECDVITTGAVSWQRRLQDLVKKPVHLIPQSVDTDWYRPAGATERVTARETLGIPPDMLLIGFVAKAGANSRDRKGAMIFSELVRNLRLKRSFGVLLAGLGWESLAAALRQSGVQTWHQSYSHCHETKRAYSVMDVLVVTAREEGGPATVMEAMASGIPVISSPVGHVPEMIVSGENGILCPVGDIQSYALALEKLAEDGSLRQRFAGAGRQEMVSRWDDQVVIPRIDFETLRVQARKVFQTRSEKEMKRRRARLRWMLWRDKVAGWLRSRHG